MSIFHALVLGIVEGLTEFLPVSSTGHLILAAKLLNVAQTEAAKSFEIAIQVGAILAVVHLYAKKLLTQPKLRLATAAAFLPAAIVGFLLYPLIKGVFFEDVVITVTSLVIGGLILILIDRQTTNSNPTLSLESLTVRKALFIGTIQAVSVIPGVSRAGASIVGGLMSGLSRTEAVSFSFLLAIPTILAAATLDLIKNPQVFVGVNIVNIIVGFITAFIVARLTVAWFLTASRRLPLAVFGWYRIAVALGFILLYQGLLA